MNLNKKGCEVNVHHIEMCKEKIELDKPFKKDKTESPKSR